MLIKVNEKKWKKVNKEEREKEGETENWELLRRLE